MSDRLVLSGELLAAAGIRAALERQCQAPPDLLPPDPGDRAVHEGNRLNSVTNFIVASASRGVELEDRTTMAAFKSKYATRPVTPLSLPERVLLDHLVSLIAGQLNEHDLTDEVTSLPYRDFTKAPIDANSAWVVGADVNSYYQYIDHDTLTDELIGRTGAWAVARTVRDMLAGVLQTRVGLPQGFRPVRVLADVYMAACVRRLRREGYATWCHSDDLRIGVASHPDAYRALHLLEDSLRDAGLSLNTEKCWVRSREAYAEWERRPDDLLAAFAQEHDLEVDLWQVANYPWDVDDGDVAAEDEAEVEAQHVRSTLRRIFEWTATRQATHGGAEEWSHRRVVGEALRKGRTYSEAAGLPQLPRLIADFPQLTPEICRYLRAMGPLDDGEARQSLHEMAAGGRFLSPWQMSWLAWASSSFTVSQRFLTRCQALITEDSNEIPVAWASSVLCMYGRVEASDLASKLSAVSSPVARNIYLQAIARMAPAMSARRRGSLAADSVERAVVDFYWGGE